MKTLLIIFCCIPAFCSMAQPTEEQIRQVEEAKKEVKKMKGKLFPDFELTAMDGTTYNKENLEGKILVINFWFTRCRPCIEEMPEMNEMVEEFKDEEIVFLAPTFESNELVNKFLNKRDFNYEIVPDVKDFCLELNVRSYPTHFVVNREGTIEKVIIGYNFMSISALRKSVRKLLKS
ncbi:TlpA family protein disulfide reductase [Ekhidna sp. To15]|uniref:TlpA family protein disulfide reductase n=1 Tax=Ekhidna sp. To15 TaxID=3395267 RepID=UPI003F527338